VKHGLVDELRFWAHPVVFGDGVRPFHASGPVPMELAASATFSSGVVLLSYGPTQST
jgi:hypothetical protein